MTTRRSFLASSTIAAALAPSASAAATRLPIKKALIFGMLPKDMPLRDRFQVARDAGFDQIECYTTDDQAQVEAIRKASEDTGLRIHSVMNQAHWQYPLSAAEPEIVEKSMKGMETSLRNAHFWGADTVLLVPAVVNPKTSYGDAWTRSQAQIRKLIPLAQELKVVIAVEEVWNKFLLSPLEFKTYIDSFNSPWVKAYFDVGNVVLYGYPQDWIKTLGPRIAKLHIKDFSFKKRVAEFGALREGEIDWKAIHAALAEIGYKGTATVELSGGDAAYLKEVNRRFDLILEGA